MSVGKQLLFSVLSAEDAEARRLRLGRLVDLGIVQGMFPNPDEQRAFTFMADYRVRYGVCPSVSLVEVETEIRFPQYLSQSPFEFWLDEFIKYVRHTGVIELIEDAERLLIAGKGDVALALIGDEYVRLRELARQRKPVASLREMADTVIEGHRLLQTGALHEGVYTGFPYIDTVTDGVQPGDFWVLAGESSTGKTFVLCRCALSAVATGRKVLLFSMEMPNRQISRRMLAMGAGVSATNFRLGRLSHFAVDRVHDFIRTWNRDQDSRFIMVEGRIDYSVKDVKAKIMEEKPDLVLIDGAYMLRAGTFAKQRWEVNVEVLETLKQIAMEENIGIMGTFQFDQKQRTKGLSSIMGGQAVGQIASVVLGIENEENANTYDSVTYKELTLYKGREGEQGTIRLRYDMNRTSIVQDRIINGIDDLSDNISIQNY